MPSSSTSSLCSNGALLVANRGEIAIRVLRAAADLGIRTVAVYAEDDEDALHRVHADQSERLPGTGPAAYLDAARLVDVARANGCTAVHPGYGFLSESAVFAASCEDAQLAFVGPRPETLRLFGDKLATRRLAEELAIPVARGTAEPVTADQAAVFGAELGPGSAMILKSVAGGGGRGIRVVRDLGELAEAYARAQAEGRLAFGEGSMYIEEFIEGARHIEVQLLGDGGGEVRALGERDCSIQRRHQKMIEIAPAPALADTTRRLLTDAATRLGEAVRLRGVATVEFLVRTDGSAVLLEVNPRLQVEHTVTEEVTGVDLVAAQLRIAAGASLAELPLPPRGQLPRGMAVQARVNAETLLDDGTAHVAGGALRLYEPPSGPGVRVDGCGYGGLDLNPRYDSLLAKVVVHTPVPELDAAASRTERALGEFRVEGAPTNIGVLRAVLRHPEVLAGRADTAFFDRNAADLVAAGKSLDARAVRPAAGAVLRPVGAPAGADDPLPAGRSAISSSTPGVVVEVEVTPGDVLAPGGTVAVVEAMKMQTAITTATGGLVHEVLVKAGDTVAQGTRLVVVTDLGAEPAPEEEPDVVDLDAVRPDLDAVLRRQAGILDAARPEAVEARHRIGRRTARENIDDLCDEGSFVEYGGLAIAAQRGRRELADLIANTPADGVIAGIGRVNGAAVDPDQSACAVMSYDYTVLAGTQGMQGHRKSDRLFGLVERLRLPVVLFAEGGGGRPGDTDFPGVGFGDLETFPLFAGLSGRVPTVGIASGRCFAGNAALLGCCDVVIATADATIGMAGPRMIEGAGLGSFRPEEVGPAAMHASTGVVDILVSDDAAAVDAARRYLSYFQGPIDTWEAADQRRTRALVPEDRVRGYDVRSVITTLADTGSVLELGERFGGGIVTALARIEGRPIGVVANDPRLLGGAIEPDGADKAARFLQLCDAFGLPVLSLCDTPGFMVGPEAEKRAQVRRFARLFLVGANLTVPTFTVVLRKGYGLGGVAMAGGSWRAPVFTVGWPTAEFGAMGIEGAVHLAHRSHLDAMADPVQRQEEFGRLVAREYERGRALNAAAHFEIDDVIDPADTRSRLARALRACPPALEHSGGGRLRAGSR